MAHEIDFSNNRENMAYVGQKPWHNLGVELEEDQPIEQWKIAAGLDWTVESSDLSFSVGDQLLSYDNRKVLYRSDTNSPLGVVSGNRYKVVQPDEILEFYRDLVKSNDFSLETAGSLKGGQVVWALAKTNESFTVGKDDLVKGYLLLTTGTDGKRSTTAQFTSTRVVCNNTLEMSLMGDSGISVRHCSMFDSLKVKSELGLNNIEFVEFGKQMNELSKYNLKDKEAMEFIIKTMNNVKTVDLENVHQVRKINNIYDLYKGEGIGSQMESSKATLWGAVNAVTEYVDHHAGRNDDTRMTSAWLGGGRDIKNRALSNALKMVA